VAGDQTVEHAQKLASSARARHLLAADVPAAATGSAKLLKLCVKRLPVGREAGVADEAFPGSVSVISYGNRKPLTGNGLANLPKVLNFAPLATGSLALLSSASKLMLAPEGQRPFSIGRLVKPKTAEER
jgi:hypothetical protein